MKKSRRVVLAVIVTIILAILAGWLIPRAIYRSSITEISNPNDWDILDDAKPGDVIWLNGGEYPGLECTGIAGTEDKPIIIRAERNERVTIKGHVYLTDCPYIWLWDVEISGTRAGDDGYHPGQGTRLINSVIHNFTQGATSGSAVPDYEHYGNLFYHNGIPGNAYGHGVYSQHFKELINGSGWAVFENNIVYDNYGCGFEIYGSKTIQNVIMRHNVSFNTGRRYEYVIGGELGLEGLLFDQNISFHEYGVDDYYSTRIGMYGTWKDVIVTGNLFAGVRPLYLAHTPDVYHDNLVYYTTTPPDRVIVTPNKYDQDRATVVIFNSSGKDFVDILLPFSGDVYLKNVQDYFVDWQDVDVIDGKVRVDMRAAKHTVEKPYGAERLQSTFPAFGVFIAQKKYPTVHRLYFPVVMKNGK